jgi:hypothetical protein
MHECRGFSKSVRQSGTSAKPEFYFVFFEKLTYLFHVNLWPLVEDCFKLLG